MERLNAAVRLIVLLVLMTFSIPLSAQDANTDDGALDRIDQALIDLVDSRDFSGAVLIGHGDDMVFRGGYGYAVIEWEVPNTSDTVFRIGSITKQFTGMAILTLQEAGLLDVDDLICDYLDDCPDAWSDITIYHLLTHTSGIFSYTDSTTIMRDLMFSTVSSNAVIDTFIERPLNFEPGSQWAYSNSGYHLLGNIIAEASGVNYRRYLQDTFFEPLGMENTDVEINTGVIPHRAEGYTSSSLRADYVNMNVPYSAGALISTVEDLFLWERALFTGQLVSQAALDEMWERAFPIDANFIYAYGLAHETREGQEVIVHGGGINGFTSEMLYVPELDLTLIVLTNRESGVVQEALQLMFDEMVAVLDS
jgi:CubicO group peptidase (beta-lactamase class C family)